MSKNIKLTIAIVLILVLGLSTIIVFNFNQTKNGKKVTQTSISSSSLSSSFIQSSSTTSQSLSSISNSSSLLNQSSSYVQSSITSSSQSFLVTSKSQVSKVVEVSAISDSYNLESNPDSVYPPKVELVDANNIPQFVQDYLKCDTKFFQIYNGFWKYKKEDKFQYTCIPQNIASECKGYEIMFGNYYMNKEAFIFENNIRVKKRIQDNKIYCIAEYGENSLSLSLPGIIGRVCEKSFIDKIDGYLIIPKSVNYKDKPLLIGCIKIPINIFSRKDQEYLINNIDQLDPGFINTK
jgi:hypothetical protein